ncbi:MAG TPA: hypothetical protein VN668_16065 [Stellaceae bacterium]|nr:hypothetical protein [Stellaceae bacterium]
MANPPFAIVLRISDVAPSRSDLEAALGVRVVRYEATRTGSLHYAQVDVIAGDIEILAEDDLWAQIIVRIEQLGPHIRALRNDHLIGRVSIDLAVSFGETSALATYHLPSRVAEVLGREGIDIEFSVYLVTRTNDDEGTHIR